MSLSRGLTGTTDANANLLVDQLTMQSGSDSYWRKWSIDHPSHAKILWPTVQKLAQRELYVLLPALLERAGADHEETSESVARLQQTIDGYCKEQYTRLISDMNDAGRTELADELLKEASQDFPEEFPEEFDGSNLTFERDDPDRAIPPAASSQSRESS
ncbi:hypothetical protein N9N28_00840 [Rubripirellula amarantea]|nr:hypothetical protein [Rubripirellula amarantea]